MHTYIEIIKRSTDSPIKRIDVTGQSERGVERICIGLGINLNHAEYYLMVRKNKDPLELIDNR